MQVAEASVVEKLVYCERERVTDTENSTECVGSEAQVCIFAEKFWRLLFGLQRVLVGIAIAEYHERFGFEFHFLSLALAFHQLTGSAYTGAEFDTIQGSSIQSLKIHHYLQIGGG
jgi:hypothetical protein